MRKISKIKTILFKIPLCMAIVNNGFIYASDHIDFTGAQEDISVPRDLDLTDLFAWIPSENKITVALNTHLSATKDSRFSDDHIYRFRFKKVEINEKTNSPLVTTNTTSASQEVIINCKADNKKLELNCTSQGGLSNFNITSPLIYGESTSNKLEEVTSSIQKGDVRLFAGLRADPFILNIQWATFSTLKSILAEKAPLLPFSLSKKKEKRSSFSDDLNVLNITLEFDSKRLFGSEVGSKAKYLAVAADVIKKNNDASMIIIDRVGRPELTNMTIKKDEIKELYNREDTFSLIAENIDTYLKAINTGIKGWDYLNKNNHDWSDEVLSEFSNILVNDYLVVDLNGVCTKESNGKIEFITSYLDIETNRKENGRFRSCGGRTPTDDIVDTLVSYYVSGPKASNREFGDGADSVLNPPTTTWPYFSEPNLKKN